jgi:hypothetical protein
VGEDGSTVTINDGISSIIVEDATGFDSANYRTAIMDIPVQDGAVAGATYLGQRPITVSGHFGVYATAATRNAQWASMKRALRGLRKPATLRTQPSGYAQLQVAAMMDNIRAAKDQGILKTWTYSGICLDPRIYAVTASTFSLTGVSPINLSVTNNGNYESPMVATITGPISTGWTLLNVTTGEQIVVNQALTAGQTIVIDTHFPPTVKQGATDRYSAVTFPGATFFRVDPGTYTIRLTGSGTTTATGLQVVIQDAWE